MCLAVPGKIVEKRLDEADGMAYGRIDFGGVFREVNLSLTPEAEINDYVVVHVGFALNVLNEEEAKLAVQTLQEIEAGANEVSE
jgi:hydrogenase expression/formation protein HypC